MGTDRIRRILVVGAGTMGHSLAQTFAHGGYQVALVDINGEKLERATSLIASNLRSLEELGLLEKREITDIIERIGLFTSLDEGSEKASSSSCLVERLVSSIAAVTD